ncbi:MAG: hypothetical protein N2999_06695, partial [Proteobacteria bacterium]|nr:hypothetical protein [Pseudomonadota bacterium]
MRKDGFALISVIISFVIISLMALLITNIISTESTLSVDKFYSSKSYYSAQAGFENAKRILSKVYKWYT